MGVCRQGACGESNNTAELFVQVFLDLNEGCDQGIYYEYIEKEISETKIAGINKRYSNFTAKSNM